MVLSCYGVTTQKDLYLHIFGFCLNTFHIGENKNDAQCPHILCCIYCIHWDVHEPGDDLNEISRKKIKEKSQLK
jgi:hypothetical protein